LDFWDLWASLQHISLLLTRNPLLPQAGGPTAHHAIAGQKDWFVHAHNGRVRACTADGARLSGDRHAPC
jgi:hypothetical protein